MRKRNIVLFLFCTPLTILSFFLIWFFFLRYALWQKVTIDFGTFKVPREWVVTHRKDVIYITGKSIYEGRYKIYLIGVEWGRIYGEYRHELFENAELIRHGRGVIYSNSAIYRRKLFNIDGIEKEKYVIVFSFLSDPPIYFFAWDNLLDEDTIIKITRSFNPRSP